MVPEGWMKSRLGSVAELQRGFDLPSSQRVNGCVPIVSSGGVTGYHSVAKTKAPGVVTGRYGSIGEVFYLEEDYWPLNTSLWVKDFHGNYEKFIYYLLSNFDFKKFSDKTGVPGVNRNDLHAVQVSLPPIYEQKKIAQILSTWDKAIATTEQLLANSQQQKKALMQQLFTGKKRLLDGNGVRFSRKWKATEIGDLLKESRIPSKVNDPTKRLTVRLNLKGIEAREFRGTEAVESTAHFVRAAGQFIYGKQNIHKGAFGIIPEELDAYESSQDLPAFDFTGICDSIWFYHYITQENFFTSLEDKMSGTGSKRLNPKSFFKINIVCPSIDEQKKIATVLNTADQDIEHLKQKIEFLKQEKKALMQQLLTGKRRVKIDDKEGG